MADRVIIMGHGEIAQIGRPQEIFRAPKTRFVAEFVGSVNLFEGRLTATGEDHVRIDCPELENPVHVSDPRTTTTQGTVWVAIRPEKIQLSTQPPQAAANWTQGQVREIAYLGDLSVLLIRLDSGKTVRVTRPNAWRQDDQGVTWEQQVYLQWHDSSPVVVGA